LFGEHLGVEVADLQIDSFDLFPLCLLNELASLLQKSNKFFIFASKAYECDLKEATVLNNGRFYFVFKLLHLLGENPKHLHEHSPLKLLSHTASFLRAKLRIEEPAELLLGQWNSNRILISGGYLRFVLTLTYLGVASLEDHYDA